MPPETTRRLHLVRHGEVHNPDGVLYGRLPGFRLSELGERMAASAADHLVESGRRVTHVRSSPLERAVASAAPIAEAYSVPIETRDGIIEAFSKLEGGTFDVSLKILGKPAAWRYLVNPFRPTWGEPYREVADRMLAEMDDAWQATDGHGDVALVSHQLPIWMAHRRITGAPLVHDPRKRRCSLSSITSFTRSADGWTEVGYWAPPADLRKTAVDTGAV